eukprot:scaffold234628_cov51-Attheya_sp.AAC.1
MFVSTQSRYTSGALLQGRVRSIQCATMSDGHKHVAVPVPPPFPIGWGRLEVQVGKKKYERRSAERKTRVS